MINLNLQQPSGKTINKLKDKLLQSEVDIQKGKVYSVEETVTAMRHAVEEVADAQKE